MNSRPDPLLLHDVPAPPSLAGERRPGNALPMLLTAAGSAAWVATWVVVYRPIFGS